MHIHYFFVDRRGVSRSGAQRNGVDTTDWFTVNEVVFGVIKLRIHSISSILPLLTKLPPQNKQIAKKTTDPIRPVK